MFDGYESGITDEEFSQKYPAWTKLSEVDILDITFGRALFLSSLGIVTDPDYETRQVKLTKPIDPFAFGTVEYKPELIVEPLPGGGVTVKPRRLDQYDFIHVRPSREKGFCHVDVILGLDKHGKYVYRWDFLVHEMFLESEHLNSLRDKTIELLSELGWYTDKEQFIHERFETSFIELIINYEV